MDGLFYGEDWLTALCKFYLVLFELKLNFYRFGSAGICGLGLPFMIEKMLKQYGYATTLRAYGVAIVCISAVKLREI
ncbi:MAG: hypothetical protein CL912_19280 [Deltaproteobacteria bacterium]|jgi:hypothetical protein|nr:hypothetical protein [Deltaproteobacteria bacterium]|tara:strand:+ start:412 stop:642 length:231 start_codon:yes stop_codon:yes gene_type:complete